MKKGTLLLLLLFALTSVGQETYNDARLWVGIRVEKDLNKIVSLYIKQRTRFDQNMSRFELGYARTGLAFKLNRHFKLAADYALALKQKKTELLALRHVFFLSAIVSADIRRWKFMYRNMLQVRYHDPYTSDNGLMPRTFDRHKATIKYKLSKRFGVYAAEELRFVINNPQASGADRSRTYAGLTIKITRQQELELFFCYQAQLQDAEWYRTKKKYPNTRMDRDYIYGLNYNFGF